MLSKTSHFRSRLRTAASPLLNRFSAASDPKSAAAAAAAAAAAYRIITTSPSVTSMSRSLASANIPFTSDLLDGVLRRFRFGHGNALRALDFFSLSTAHHAPSPFSHDTLLYILGRSRRFPDAWSLLAAARRSDPSLITPRTIHILLGRIAKVCSVRQTVESFRKLRNLSPATLFATAAPFNALLRNLCIEKSMSDARNVYHSLKHEFRPDLHTFNTLLSGWKSAADAESFFEEMRQLGVQPDVVSYNCLIDVYCKNRQLDNAYKMLDEMRAADISPDVITYTSLIGGLGLVGQPDKARDLLKEMKEYGCPPDVPAYNATIRNYCIAKRLGNAFALMEEMRKKGMSPNATSYNLFFRVYYWANDLVSSWNLYRKMRGEGCLPNTQSCMFLVRLFRRQEKVEMALEFWDDMVREGFGSFTLVSDVLFDLLCDAGKLDEVERCFYQMIERGQKPSNVSFKRVKVLMELANRNESISKLYEKMAIFGHLAPKKDDIVDISADILQSPSSHPC